MGPGILIKAVLQGSFSLMVFGWTQIVMDIQPLLVLLTGAGHLHGFTHTFIGATLLAVFAALSGKYLSECGLQWLQVSGDETVRIKWSVTLISAFIGSYTHVVLDAIMHSDVQPFFPFDLSNGFLGLVSVKVIQQICIATGLVGGLLFFGVQWWKKKKSH